jgi:hypothetical protein
MEGCHVDEKELCEADLQADLQPEAFLQRSDSDYAEKHRHAPAQHHEPAPQLEATHTVPDGYMDEKEYESDYEPPISFNLMAMNADDEFDDDDAGELNAEDNETLEGPETRAPKSIILPTYDAEIGGTIRKMLIDTGASTVYASRSLVGLRTTKVKARRVEVADKDKDTLHIETLTAYVFPLKEIDLGLLWLEKHNPRVDFRTKAYEFGRRYTLHPATTARASKIRVVEAEESRSFLHEDLEAAVPSSSHRQR